MIFTTLWLFGIVAAGEVHPQPQFFPFGNIPTTIFQWWVPSLTVVQPQVTRSSSRLLLVIGKWMKSGATTGYKICSSYLCPRVMLSNKRHLPGIVDNGKNLKTLYINIKKNTLNEKNMEFKRSKFDEQRC